MADIGPNSNRRQVALAVSALQDQVGASTPASSIASIQAEVDALQLDGRIVAGPQTLTDTVFLTKAVLRKVLTVAAGPNSSTVDVAHGITSPTRILGCVIQLTNGTNHLCFGGGGYFHATAATGISVAINGTNVSLTSGASGDYSLYAGSIILLYTLVA